jgi:hypothetical protein
VREIRLSGVEWVGRRRQSVLLIRRRCWMPERGRGGGGGRGGEGV